MSLEPQGCPAPGACACIGENANLIGIIARIRQLSGVGDKPDLADLPEAIAARLQEPRREAFQQVRILLLRAMAVEYESVDAAIEAVEAQVLALAAGTGGAA